MTTSPQADEAISHASKDQRLEGHVTVLDGVRGIAILAVTSSTP